MNSIALQFHKNPHLDLDRSKYISKENNAWQSWKAMLKMFIMIKW